MEKYKLLFSLILSLIVFPSFAVTYDIVVAKDGTGRFTSVQAAFNAVVDNKSTRTVIYIKNGVYKEVLTLASSKKNVTIIGESASGVVLTYNNNSKTINPATGSPYGTGQSASTFIKAEGFYANNITFQNSSTLAHAPALAISITGDKAVFVNCIFLGPDDTVYNGDCRQYFQDCYLSGNTDFIFGSSTAVFERCTLHMLSGSAITAASTQSYIKYGYVFLNCKVTAPSGITTTLGRPWRPYASVAFINSDFGSVIKAVGWDNWGNVANEATARFCEYKNTSNVTPKRPGWICNLSDAEVKAYNTLNILKTTYSSSPIVDNWNPFNVISSINLNTAPTVSITSPVTNSNYTSPATVLVKAKALDSDGTISKVEFFQGTTKIGEDLTGVSGEYTFSWTNVAAGSYTITAKATDDDGATKVSTGIVVNVKAPVLVAPKVALTSPLTGASDKSPATFAFAATASDADGTITKVEFWGRRGGTTTNVLLGSDATAPYTFNWQNITAEGDYFVFAKAIDDDGLETNTAVITIKVLPKNVAPVVSITSPITNASYIAPADINLTVNATDSDGKITKVEYFNGTTKLGEDLVTPYSYSIIDLPVGTYTLTAKATDNDGAISTSTGIIVKVTAPVLVPPVVTLNTPTASQVFTTPASVSFTATATDKDGTISKVEFWGRKSGTSSVVLLGSDASSPYSYNWATSEIGGYLVYAKAFDNDGQMTNSTVVNITIKAPNVLPTVQFISPLSSEVINFGENVDLEIFAEDVDGSISKVEIYNGVNKVTTLLADPYIYNWASLAPGTYTVTAKAYDNEGASKVSSSVTFKVNAAPKVTITSPTSSTNFVAPADISISATATDADGTISKVEFYNGSVKLGEDVSSPFVYSIIDLSSGTYKIIAKAVDNNGFYSEPDTVSIVVTTPVLVPPTVTLLTPSNGQVIASSSLPVKFTATASDADGNVTKVEFWGRRSGTPSVVLLGSDVSSPYEFNWTPTEFGNYVVYAKAYDNDGLKTNSAVMSISIQGPNQAPTITFVAPLNGSKYNSGSSINLEVDANDDGGINKVEYYHDNVLIGQTSTSPYNYLWSSLSAGVYTLVAKAYDNQGAITSSSPIKITVNDVLTGLVDELKTNNNVLIAPNPFVDQLSFSLETSANIEVLDINGKTVFNGLVEKETINTCNWPNGIYFIKSSLDNKVFKFIKGN